MRENYAASRLPTVSDGTHSATYGYLANSPLVSQIVFKQNATTRMTTIKQNDLLNRLLSISSTPAGDSAVSYAYLYNDANQRKGVSPECCLVKEAKVRIFSEICEITC